VYQRTSVFGIQEELSVANKSAEASLVRRAAAVGSVCFFIDFYDDQKRRAALRLMSGHSLRFLGKGHGFAHERKILRRVGGGVFPDDFVLQIGRYLGLGSISLGMDSALVMTEEITDLDKRGFGLRRVQDGFRGCCPRGAAGRGIEKKADCGADLEKVLFHKDEFPV
jgi:hypothetical protein